MLLVLRGNIHMYPLNINQRQGIIKVLRRKRKKQKQKQKTGFTWKKWRSSNTLFNIDLTNRFHVAVRLFSNRSQKTSKCGKNKKVAHKPKPSVSLMFLPHFHIFCDLLLNRRTATWNLFVLYNNEKPFLF